jgi:hypothetical protein
MAQLGEEMVLGLKRLQNAAERTYFQAIWLRIELAMSKRREEV